LGRKLDDSLPDFAGFVVRGFWKYGKRAENQINTVDNRRIIHKKKPAEAGFSPISLPKQKKD